jgi:hypothetical protein
MTISNFLIAGFRRSVCRHSARLAGSVAAFVAQTEHEAINPDDDLMASER